MEGRRAAAVEAKEARVVAAGAAGVRDGRKYSVGQRVQVLRRRVGEGGYRFAAKPLPLPCVFHHLRD